MTSPPFLSRLPPDLADRRAFLAPGRLALGAAGDILRGMVEEVMHAERLAVRVSVQKAAVHERLDTGAALAPPVRRFLDVEGVPDARLPGGIGDVPEQFERAAGDRLPAKETGKPAELAMGG